MYPALLALTGSVAASATRLGDGDAPVALTYGLVRHLCMIHRKKLFKDFDDRLE